MSDSDDKAFTAFSAITTAFDETYRRWLVSRALADTPLAKAAFYAATKSMVTREPLPERTTQQDIEHHLDCQLDDAVDDFLEEVEMLFLDVTRERMGK